MDDVGGAVQGGGGAPRGARARGGAARGRIGPGVAQDIPKRSEVPRRSSERVGNGRAWSGARDARAGSGLGGGLARGVSRAELVRRAVLGGLSAHLKEGCRRVGPLNRKRRQEGGFWDHRVLCPLNYQDISSSLFRASKVSCSPIQAHLKYCPGETRHYSRIRPGVVRTVVVLLFQVRISVASVSFERSSRGRRRRYLCIILF